jgi:hypothetical protein
MAILKRYLGGKAQEWITSSGYTDEFTFWASLSGLDQGTEYDHCNTYLTAQGYTGTLRDKLRQWGQALTDGSGTLDDLLRKAADAPFSTVDLTVKQVLHYVCDDNAASVAVLDTSGNDYHGSANAFTANFDVPSGAPDGSTSCFNVQGTYNWDEADNADLRLTGSYSISFWFRPNSTWSGATAERFIQKLPGQGYLILLDSGGNNLLFYTNGGTADATVVSDASSFTGSQWYWFYGEWDGVTKTMYIDNVAQAATSSNGSTGTTTGTDVSFCHNAASAQEFDGRVWDFRFFNNVLTSAERSFIYNGGTGTTADS